MQQALPSHRYSAIMHIRRFLHLWIFCISILFCHSILIPISHGQENWTTLFSDDFEDRNAEGWSLHESWGVETVDGNSVLHGTTHSFANIETGNDWTNYRLSMRVKMIRQGLHINVRVNDEGRYFIGIGEEGIYLNKSFWANPDSEEFARTDFSLELNEWHTVAVTINNSHIVVNVDGVDRIDYTDTNNPHLQGRFSLESIWDEQSYVYVDDIEVFGVLYATPTPLPDPHPPWFHTSGPVGGYIESIEIDPNNPDILYAGGVGDGIFKSTDQGQSWVMSTTFLHPTVNIKDIIISPSDSNKLFALGTDGRIYRSTDAGSSWSDLDLEYSVSQLVLSRTDSTILYSAGGGGVILKSVDQGDSWQQIQGDLPDINPYDMALGAEGVIWIGSNNHPNGYLYQSIDDGISWEKIELNQRINTYIRTVYVNPEDNNTVYVGLGDSFNEPFPLTAQRFFKTTNNGKTWSVLSFPGMDAQVNIMQRQAGDPYLYVGSGGSAYKMNVNTKDFTLIGPPGRNGDMMDIAIHPLNPDILYLPRCAAGIVKSENGGKDWQAINEGLLNVSVSLLAVSNDPHRGDLYASAVSGEGTFKSMDWGETWTQALNEGGVNGGKGGITHPWTDELVVSPHDPNTVWQVADVGEVFQTTDGGYNWEKMIDTNGNGFRFGSVYAMAAAPSNPNTIYALKNGFGIFKSENGGNRWRFLHQSDIDYTYSIAVHPTDSNTVYSGYNPKPFQPWAMVRKTTDGGDSWETALHIEDASAVTSVAIDPNSPNTIYAGSTGHGGIVWKSQDNGKTWENSNPHFNFTNIHFMTADPNLANVAYAGVWGGGTFKTTDGGDTWTRLRNDSTPSASAILVSSLDSNTIYITDRNSPRIYKSEDGGDTWSLFFDAGDSYYRILAACLSPGDPDTIYASIFSYGGPMAGDVFRIQGNTATIVTGTLERLPVGLATLPHDPNTVYATLHGYGVYKTSNGGQTWNNLSQSNSGLPTQELVGFNGVLVDPTNPNTIYLFGGCDVDLQFQTTGTNPDLMHTVYRSTNGGLSWTNLNDGSLGNTSNSIKGISLAGNPKNTIFLGSINGIYQSVDGGQSWKSCNEDLAYTHTAGVSLSADGRRIYAPLLGGGVIAGDVDPNTGAVTWDRESHLTSTIFNVLIVIDPTDSNILYASAYPGGVFKSTDAGETWSECNFGMASFEIDDPNRQGYYAFAVSPTNPQTLYLGLYGVGMYKSQDGAATWMPMNGNDRLMRGKYITSLLIDEENENTVHVGTENGVYKTIDGGKTWESINSGLLCPDVRVLAHDHQGGIYAGTRGYEMFHTSGSAWTQINGFGEFGTFWPLWNDRPLYQYTTLLFHPTDPNIIYFGTFPAGIYKSNDGGESWKEHNVGWTNDGVFSLVPHPNDPETIFAGTYNGINRTLDGGNHWEMWDNGWPPEQWVFSIDFDPRNTDVMYACSKNGENEGTGREEFHGTVMKSTDGGASWFPITNGLDLNQEFYKIIVDRFDPDTLYLACQWDGVYISRNGGNSWSSWNKGLTNHHPATNGNNVTNTMILSGDGRYLFFGSLGSSVFRRVTITIDDDALPTSTPTCTSTFTSTPSKTATPTSTYTPTSKPVSIPTPLPTKTATPTRTATQLIPTKTPAPTLPEGIYIYDNAGDTRGDLTGTTDFDTVDNRNITIAWNADATNATDWHIYVRKGFGGMKYLGRTKNGTATSLDWYSGADNLDDSFANGPDFNSAYTFRVVRVDGQLSPDDYFDMTVPVGYNLEGGNAVSLAQPELPNLNPGQVAIYDDILGGNDLAPMGSTGSDSDSSSSRAIQIAWNFGRADEEVNEYHILVSVDGGDFDFLGQTYTSGLNYFWWTPNRPFRTNPVYADGPQDGHTYQFMVVLSPLSGERASLKSGTLQYSVIDQ